MTSNRPPTESSDFTTTYTAMRALRVYGAKDDKETIARRIEAARGWLIKTPGKETEDRVFRLLGLKESGADPEGDRRGGMGTGRAASGRMAAGSQLDSGQSDAYATGSALFALHEAGGLKIDSAAYKGGSGIPLANAVARWDVESQEPQQAVSAVLRERFPAREGPVHLDRGQRLGNRRTAQCREVSGPYRGCRA